MVKFGFKGYYKLLLLCPILITLTQCSSTPQFSHATSDPTGENMIIVTGIVTSTARSVATKKTTLTPTRILTATPLPSKEPAPSPTLEVYSCSEEKGEMQLGNLTTKLLRQPLEFRVYLPPCYKQQRNLRYPVLYLIHGQSYSDDQWDRLGADETADRLILEKKIPPFIIVMPRDRNWDQPQMDLFGEAVIDVLIPYIDARYRTLPEREFRAVGGLSRGAGWAVHLGLLHWQYFGAMGGHSLPIFQTDAPKVSTWIDAIPIKDLPRIYIDIGDKDRPAILDSAIWFEDLLTKKNVPHEWHLNNGYHDEAYWSSHVEQYLIWYSQSW